MRSKPFWSPSALALLLLATACGTGGGGGARVQTALESIRTEDLERHIQELASDAMEGRGPASPGGEAATRYIADRFRDIGLRPAGDDGTYFQEVPLVGITADKEMNLTLWHEGKPTRLQFGKEFVAWNRRQQRETKASGQLVFLGYGTQAPEFEWDDYKGFDPAGKILVMLVNDPPLPDPSQFGGRAMTYYGRWTYKFDKAREMGAEGAILIHEEEAAGYPWGTVENSWTGEQFHLRQADQGRDQLRMESWVTRDVAERIFRMAGLDLEEQKKAAVSREFTPTPLGIRATVTIRNKTRPSESKNVLGLLEGNDPARRDEYVIYVAHWDHLGKVPEVEGEDKIFNGAYDNATGTAGLFELAEAFSRLPEPPRRSILFLAVTAEEQGLLGSKFYAENPVFPLSETVAVINMDGMNIWGRTRDMVVVGLGNSSLDRDLEEIVAEQGRVIVPDSEPEKGFFYRSDQFSFAKKGVPALYADPGVDFIGKPEGWGLEQREKYTKTDYHKPSDEYDPSWDLSGAREDLQALFLLGYRVAQRDEIPTWSEGNEFKAIREESLKKSTGSP